MAEDARAPRARMRGARAGGHGRGGRDGRLSDQWRIRRGGRLVHAEALRLTEAFGARRGRRRCAAGGRSRRWSQAAPGAEARLEAARAALDGSRGVTAAASAKPGVLIVRLLAADARALRAGLIRFLMAFRDAPLPRVWSSEGSPMNLTPREKDKLLVSLAAMVARGRLARGVKLNHPEAIALITDFVVEGARDGRTVADLMEAGRARGRRAASAWRGCRR